jgi:Phosphotransferase enzyme family
MAWSPTPVSPALFSRRPDEPPADGPPSGEALSEEALSEEALSEEALSEEAPADGPLTGGTANRGLVVRVGQTVRRPATPYRAATHALLAHLAAVGFDGAPRLLATDATTDTLTYVEGRAATAPLPEETLTEAALVSIAGLLRRYHQAVASFNPAGYCWPGPIPARYITGLVSHNDVYPANVIFRGGRAAALIDFDLAGPGGVCWDLAAAARYWCPLRDERDVTDLRQGRALSRFRLLLEAYGLTAAERTEVAEAIVVNHDWDCAIIAQGVQAGHAGFIDSWNENGGTMIRARRWCQAHQRALRAAAN